jgi:uncharacterized protein YheU (UPF0270 family)
MIIPHDQLEPQTVTRLIEEFVTRDGALHGHEDVPFQQCVDDVWEQLKAGTAVIVYNEKDESASIVMRDELSARSPEQAGEGDDTYHDARDVQDVGHRDDTDA